MGLFGDLFEAVGDLVGDLVGEALGGASEGELECIAKLLKPSTSIFLKEKIDENILTNTLIKIGLVSKKIEKRYFKDNNIILDIENYFCFSYFGNNDKAKIMIDKENSCIEINCKELFVDMDDNKDNENKFILEIKEILFKEKILNEELDKTKEYENNYQQYEANTDDIIEKIEEKEKTEPYNLFIIKHFIKYVIDKYKEENISSEDNSANENNEDNKNITTNPFITNGE
ncbi:hypothetical protein EPJ74_06255 [Brachyspira aalborgi]|uniref:Uncharacterized protein n=1 Tax=Brachyspira aalborgi TaxID=29522 RepID=A0A5C8GE03_9SPIR|nr:hypothetical protein [Brachyspira aalborgi]TXJ60201.1 hypothetical protein EPJ74_06255 [Brachyspira aalborgi]